jgi:hypothetical protein
VLLGERRPKARVWQLVWRVRLCSLFERVPVVCFSVAGGDIPVPDAFG